MSINRRNSSIQPQFNSFASWGWCSIFVGFPPTKLASSLNFVLLKGTPEIITDFYNTNSKSCTCYVSSTKSIGILCYFFSPNFTYVFPNTLFYDDILDCHFLTRDSDQWFAVVNSILEYSCDISNKEYLDKSEGISISWEELNCMQLVIIIGTFTQ